MDRYAFFISLLTFVSVLCLGGAVISAVITRRRALEARLFGTQGSSKSHLDDRPLAVRALGHAGELVTDKPSSDLRSRMLRAGFHGAAAPAIFMGAKLYLLAGTVAALVVTAAFVNVPLPFKVATVIAGAAVAFFLPNLYLEQRCRRRGQEVRIHLPDMVDLLEVCVSGGMGLDMAWNAVAEEIRTVSPLLADEMALTNLELHLGEERGNAIRHMAQRTGADELSSLVAVMVQSERFGTSISEALRVFAASMRELRSQRAEEEAEKMSVKMLFPMIAFIFPVVLIVAVGPAGITLYRVLTGP